MAAASISVDQDQFTCSVCLDLLKDPVAIPCGHSYCMDCIRGYWDQDDHTGDYSCPQCRKTFSQRPDLCRNTILADMVEKLKKTGLQAAPPAHCYTGPGDVACDVCTGRKRKAVRSCLVCLASYCESDLILHDKLNRGKSHKLIEATGKLQEKICSQHEKLLEVYCRTDQQFICYLCTMDEHRGHDTVSAAAERAEKQKQLGETQNKFQQRIQEREKELQDLRQAVQSLTRSAQAAVEDSERIFAELIRSIERRCSEVKELIRDQEKAAICSGLRKRSEFNHQKIFSELGCFISTFERRSSGKADSVSVSSKMAAVGDLLDWDQFKCPICLDLLKDPVAIPCGHSYCMGCITGCWDQDDHTGVYSCPQCRQTFTPRPVLGRNTILADMVEKLKKTGLQAAPPAHCYAGPGDVACDVCTGRKRKAIKSCLVCLASYCESDLILHENSMEGNHQS
ncbi:hypothetical protein AGOR_G00033060 [Albula goreensis]|uniref:E3 ubiquitin/ISG15 ligase TRIM25-like n=1 Tax=Albula goreensis TaxID=1534307 RepID=A0A8T3E130_9TELE|nr:hypothetical protein AGOR_G00033060 [Albula goreensis]